MKIVIIDCRLKRRGMITTWLQSEGHVVNSSDCRDHLAAEPMAPDLLLLHVGVTQRDNEDNFGAILSDFSTASWTVGYSGGATAEEAEECALSKFSKFTPTVPLDGFPLGLKNVITKVLLRLSEEEPLGPDEFKSIVTDFDPILEIKLQTLANVLNGESIELISFQRLAKHYPELIDQRTKRLLLVSEDRAESALYVRDRLFRQ